HAAPRRRFQPRSQARQPRSRRRVADTAAPTDPCPTEFRFPRGRPPTARRLPLRTRRRPAQPPSAPYPAGRARKWFRPARRSPAPPENRSVPATPPEPRHARRQRPLPRPPRLRRRPAHRRKWWQHASDQPWLLYLPPHVSTIVIEVFPLWPRVQPNYYLLCPAHHWPAPVRRRTPLGAPPRDKVELLPGALARRGREVVGWLEQILVGRQRAFS